MVDTVPVEINDRWTLQLLPHRVPQFAKPWESERLADMADRLRAGMHIVDVGAEEGDFPALWASWGCSVSLVEPDPRVWPNMRATFEANGLTQPMVSWVGFACDVDDDHGGRVAGKNGWPPEADGNPIVDHRFRHLSQQANTTPQVRLDTMLHFNHVDAITIDVEGSELAVLEGAKRILLFDRPVVWVSIHTDHRWMDDQYPTGKARDVHRHMRGMGYVGTHLATDHEEHWRYDPT